MAVKKKASVKKVAKKAPAKKAVKKAAVKKVAKKAPAKKKAAVKKVVKKTTAKKATAKKAAVKKVAKKSAKKATTTSKIVVPPVPVGGVKSPSRANITTMPTPAKSAPATKSTASKPSAAPKQGTSPRILMAAIIAIALLAVVVITRPASESDDAVAPEMPVASESATPEPTESAPVEAVAAVEAPTRFIGNWKDSSKSVMVITWNAPTATAGLTGYKFEVRSGMGPWTESGILPADQLSIEFKKASTDGSTSFRISSVYSDGQSASAKAFGFSGQFL